MFTFYSRIIVGYDASELSKKALEMAKKLAEQDERIEIHVLSVIKSILVFCQDFGQVKSRQIPI